MGGMQILEKIKKMTPAFDGLVIILTAYGNLKDAISAMKLGAYDYITKPFNNESLILSIEKALNTTRLSRELVSLKKQLRKKQVSESTMGKSAQISKILKQVEIIAPTNMSVLIQGASGTGKEVIAKMIHQKSLRKDKVFIPIDCGAIPDALFESELFGYEKGAFTGADQAKKGKFELANEGTILLDEITNLPDSAQAKFLRAIEERTIQPLGGNKEIAVDVRIIANSNRDLVQAVYEGKFREDLYQRLNQFKIKLPLLQERRDDIPVLAKFFWKKQIESFTVILRVSQLEL
jgi:DNA-binding NtrC family response regulator